MLKSYKYLRDKNGKRFYFDYSYIQYNPIRTFKSGVITSFSPWISFIRSNSVLLKSKLHCLKTSLLTVSCRLLNMNSAISYNKRSIIWVGEVLQIFLKDVLFFLFFFCFRSCYVDWYSLLNYSMILPLSPI